MKGSGSWKVSNSCFTCNGHRITPRSADLTTSTKTFRGHMALSIRRSTSRIIHSNTRVLRFLSQPLAVVPRMMVRSQVAVTHLWDEPNFDPPQHFAGWQTASGRSSSTARSEVYRQSTGSILSSGADLATCLSQSLPFRTTVQPDTLKDFPIRAYPHHSQHSWSPGAPVCPRVYVFIILHSAFHRESISYHKVKRTATTYQAVKRSLSGPSAPFAGWIVSGEEWESFNAHGELPRDVRTQLS